MRKNEIATRFEQLRVKNIPWVLISDEQKTAEPLILRLSRERASVQVCHSEPVCDRAFKFEAELALLENQECKCIKWVLSRRGLQFGRFKEHFLKFNPANSR